MVSYDRAVNSLNHSAQKVGTGKKLNSASEDSGSLAVAMKLDMDKLKTNSHKVNLQNFITFLQSQDDALSQASRIYERMGELAQMATDPFLTEAENGASSDKELLNIEFKELSERLSSLIDMETNGRRLFGGVKTDFTQGLQDRNDFSPTNLPQVTTKDVQSTSGVITLELSPGVLEDQIWIFQGELPSEFNSFFNPPAGGGKADTSGLTDKLYEYFDGSKDSSFQGIFTTGRWQTFGGSKDGNFDTFTIDFNSCETKLNAEFHSNNKTPSGVFSSEPPTDAEIQAANYNKLLGSDLKRRLELDGELLLNAPEGISTKITMIGVNTGNTATYEVTAAYEPSLPYNDIDVPGTEDIFPAISFGELECSSISTKQNALNALREIDAQFENLLNSRASIAAAQNRYHHELDKINLGEMSIEQAHSRIIDADFAQEATNLAKQMLSAQMATDSARKSMKFMDLLIPLTTNHHRSHVLETKLY
jgi:flagellin-like hook-associated protein FlgL